MDASPIIIQDYDRCFWYQYIILSFGFGFRNKLSQNLVQVSISWQAWASALGFTFIDKNTPARQYQGLLLFFFFFLIGSIVSWADQGLLFYLDNNESVQLTVGADAFRITLLLGFFLIIIFRKDKKRKITYIK